MLINTENFKKNYKTIIGVTLLAFLLWFMVKMDKVYEYTIDIPIQYVNLDTSRVFKRPQSANVRVEFTGKGKDMLRLPFYHIRYEIDLSDAPYHTELDLSQHPEYVRYPGELNVKVKSVIRPRILVIDLDKKVTKKLPVKVQYELDTPPGYILVGVKKKPDSVQVTGPAEMFKTLKELVTEKRTFSQVSQAFWESFSLQKIPDYYAQYQPPQIEVFFDVQRLAEKELMGVPVTVINVPKGVQVIPLPSEAALYIKGGEKILAELSEKDFQIIIDFKKDWRPGMQKVKATIQTSGNVLYMETHPPEFELIVQKKHSK